jgi:hypothetical protein
MEAAAMERVSMADPNNEGNGKSATSASKDLGKQGIKSFLIAAIGEIVITAIILDLVYGADRWCRL